VPRHSDPGQSIVKRIKTHFRRQQESINGACMAKATKEALHPGEAVVGASDRPVVLDCRGRKGPCHDQGRTRSQVAVYELGRAAAHHGQQQEAKKTRPM
jgi:hypothetical protein